jgi:hypothetical protein
MISRCAISGRGQRVRPSPFRWYTSTQLKPKKDLPPPLPPKASSSSSQTLSQTKQPKLSPAQAKKEYLEAQKRTDAFLKDPKASIARLQADMDMAKEKLLRVHDKPIWRRIVDRFKAKQHGVINLLAASMAYILAHRLHLKMKANDELQEQVDLEKTKNSELRSLLRLLSSEEFASDVVSQATTEVASTETKSSSWLNNPTKQQGSSSSSSLPQKDALVTSLRQTLEARIGDEGLEDADRKQKKIQDIWEENEQRIEDTEEGLAALAAAIAAEGPQDATTNDSKKRVFDM